MALFKSSTIEGPGVDKNEAEKRGFIRFFELFRSNYWNLLFIGLISLLFNVSILLYGLGAVGAARTARIAVRNKHIFKSYYTDAIKKNWRQALPMGIINNILLAITGFCTYYFHLEAANPTVSGYVMLGISGASLIIVTFIRYYTPAVLITFNVTLGQLYKNAIILSFAGLLRNFGILIIHLITYFIALAPMLIFNLYVGAGITVCLYAVLVPALRYYTTQYHIYPVMFKYMIKPFMESHPGEGENTLRELGLIEAEEEPVMEDSVE